MLKIEQRTAENLVISGYVNAVDRKSRVLHDPKGKPFVEVVKSKTFERALAKANNVEMTFNHEQHLGSTAERNLELYEDSIGLFARATITNPAVINRADNFTGWSFTFIPNKQEFSEDENGITQRTLTDIDLLEVSILDKTPAYYATSVTNVEYRDNDCTTKQIETRFEEKAEEIVADADNIPPVSIDDEIEQTPETTENETETKEIKVNAVVEEKKEDNKAIFKIKEMEIEIEKIR